MAAMMQQNNADLMTVRQLSIRLEDATSSERLEALDELQVCLHVSMSGSSDCLAGCYALLCGVSCIPSTKC